MIIDDCLYRYRYNEAQSCVLCAEHFYRFQYSFFSWSHPELLTIESRIEYKSSSILAVSSELAGLTVKITFLNDSFSWMAPAAVAVVVGGVADVVAVAVVDKPNRSNKIE